MKQNINLYHPIFRKEAKRFSAQAMLQAAALVVIGAIAVYGFNFYQLRELRAQVREAERAQEAAMSRLAQVTQKFGRMPVDATALEIARLEQELVARRRLQALAQDPLLANTRGYTDFFLAFSRQHVPGVWLTHVRLRGRGDDMELQGRAIAPALIPRYIERLANERVLAGLEFKAFDVTRADANSGNGYVDFRAGGIRGIGGAS